MTPPKDESIQVLHVDDDPDFGALTAQCLEREDERLAVYTVTTPEEGLAVLHEWEIDCVVSGSETGGGDGLEFRSAVYAEYPELPFLRWTESGGESTTSPSRSAGVRDGLTEGSGTAQYEVLANRITNVVDRDRTDVDRRRHPHATETAPERMGPDDASEAMGPDDASEAMAPDDDGDARVVDGRQWVVYRCRNELGRPMEAISGDVRELTGYSATALWSGEVSFGTEVTHAEDRAEVWTAYKNAVDADGSYDLTYRIVTDDGDTRTVWEHGQVSPQTGGVTTFEGFITDVTDLVR